MKFKLKVQVSKSKWKLGIRAYDTLIEAENRQKELIACGIKSIIVDEFGGKIK